MNKPQRKMHIHELKIEIDRDAIKSVQDLDDALEYQITESLSVFTQIPNDEKENFINTYKEDIKKQFMEENPDFFDAQGNRQEIPEQGPETLGEMSYLETMRTRLQNQLATVEKAIELEKKKDSGEINLLEFMEQALDLVNGHDCGDPSCKSCKAKNSGDARNLAEGARQALNEILKAARRHNGSDTKH